MSESIHNMTTRSKCKKETISNPPMQDNDEFYDEFYDDDIDENGNLKDFIDYECDEDFDRNELNKVLNGLSNKKSKKTKSRTKDKKTKINEIFMSYLIMRATEKANLDLKKKRRKRNNKIRIKEEVEDEIEEEVEEEVEEKNEKINLDNTQMNKSNLVSILNADFDKTDSDDESYTSNASTQTNEEDIELSENSSSEISDSETDKNNDSDSENEDYGYEYDKLDEKYEELIDKHALLNSEESNMEFYHYLPTEHKEKILKMTQEIYDYNGTNTPLRFQIIESEMDMKTKAIALENLDKLAEMDVSTGEHSKMDHWINGLMRIPFGKYNSIPITKESSIDEKREYIKNTYKTLNKAIYGHKEAKTHILQVIGKWMKNPNSGGNVLAIQGPMGNGKTTLVKEGISKVLNRPFAFIALGGASDSAYFDGHCFTYEGSHWGRIVQILHDSKCMNPVIYFDELDKISDTNKGDEIIHMLTHLTDPSQNSLFQDNYFPGVNLDLSKALFIFSYNDESKVNKILKDRMYVIHTKGFKTEDKLKICKEYLIPEIFDTFAFNIDEIKIDDEILKEIIDNHTEKEEGVRNLKRCIETIVSKINIHILSDGDDDLSFKLNDFKLPISLSKEHIDILLKASNKDDDKPPYGMYL